MRAVRTITNSDYRSPTASLFSKLELLDIFQVNTRDITKFMLRLALHRKRVAVKQTQKQLNQQYQFVWFRF